MTSVVVRILLPSIFLSTLLAAPQRHGGFPVAPTTLRSSNDVRARETGSGITNRPTPASAGSPGPGRPGAQTVPLDVNKVNQGLLPKDASQKLKRIEKLAKPLRSEMTPESLNLQGLRPDHLPTGGSP